MLPLATALRRWLPLMLAAGCAWCELARATDWQVAVTPAGELFPALELSQARVGDGSGLLRVRIAASVTAQPLRLTIDTPGLRAPAVVEIPPATPAEGPLTVRPRLDWDPVALHGLGGVRRQPLRATLEGPALAPETRTLEVRLHPLDEALYYARDGGDRVDLGWAFAAFVDPADAAVDAILASARTLDPRFDATGTGALRQAGAVWAALERQGLRYADEDPALARGPLLWSQRVRRPGAVWRERRANCLDGSVLIASVLERLGLEPFIVLLPGHALVGFDASGRAPVVLETTLLGAPQTPAANFAAARRAGHARWRDSMAKLDGRHGPDYARVDIGTARRYGIMPLSAGGRASRNPARVVAPAAAAPFRQSGSP